MRCAQEWTHHQTRRGLVHWNLRIHLPLRGDAALAELNKALLFMEVLAPVLFCGRYFAVHDEVRVASSPLCLVPWPYPPSNKRHHLVLVIVRCNSATLELVRAVRVRPRQTRTRPSLRLVLLSPSRSTSSRPRSKKCSTGERAALRVLTGC